MRLKHFTQHRFTGDVAALIAGAALTLAFAPFYLYPLAVICPAILLRSWLTVSPKRAFLRGALFGLAWFTTGVYWVFISIHTFGEAPIWLASVITGGFIVILALFPALNGYFLNRYFPKETLTKYIFAFPATWVGLEWLRSILFTGFPWLLLGYSQVNSPLKGFAPLFSVYGDSLMVTISSGLLVYAIRQVKQRQFRKMYVSLFIMGLIWSIGGTLSAITWTTPDGKPIQVSLVQGNIPQTVKWSPDFILPTLDRYSALTKPHWNSRLIIWPEAAIPITLQDAQDFINEISTFASKRHATLMTGIPVKLENRDQYYNTIISVGVDRGFYLKRRLVPFGEYVPLQSWLHGLLGFLNIPMSAFVPGPDVPRPLEVGKIKIAAFICYEIAYPELVRSRDGHIGLLLTVSNDAWFGHSVAQAQHLEIAQMRALELGRPLLFVSNDGITATLLPNGKIKSAAPTHIAYVLTDSVQPMTGDTPWQQFGMDPVLIALLSMLIAAKIRQRDVKK